MAYYNIGYAPKTTPKVSIQPIENVTKVEFDETFARVVKEIHALHNMDEELYNLYDKMHDDVNAVLGYTSAIDYLLGKDRAAKVTKRRRRVTIIQH